jgi:SpoVK/Ycf46/Vps4 family AAA+-type ATPase
VALLHGPPGTGKTLCARAVAGELGKPLLTVSLGHLRSKYVGESEANLSAVFRRAAAEEAVLLLDEVDSMLARRGSVRAAHHDDVLTATLLTLLDAHPGLVLLTSNRPDALDPALTRRIGWRVAFRLPDAEARDAIWRSVLPPSAPLHPALRFSRIAARYVLSGGDIRTIALRAAAHAAAQGELIDEALLDTLAATLQATAPAFARAGAPVGVA